MRGDLVLELAFENTAIQLQVGFISKIEFKVIWHSTLVLKLIQIQCKIFNSNTDYELIRFVKLENIVAVRDIFNLGSILFN